MLPVYGRPLLWSCENNILATCHESPMSSQIATLSANSLEAIISRKEPARSETNYRLQYLRAVGALCVVLYHASVIISLSGDTKYLSVFSEFFGEFGVALFFSLSGYLMASLSTKEPPFRFLLNRIIRIYPTYLIIAFSVLLLRQGLSSRSAFDISAFLLLTGGPHSYQLGSEWTLPFELTFYTIVFIISVARQQKLLFWISGAWLISIVVFQIFNFPFEWMPENAASPSLTFLPFMYHAAPFVMGIVCQQLLKTHRFNLLWVALVPLTFAFRFLVSPHYTWWVTGIAVTLLVAAAASKHSTGKPVEVLFQYGNWSYALYLIHIPIMSALGRIFPKTFPHLLLWMLLVSIPLLAAWIIGSIDVEFHSRLKRWSKRWPNFAVGAVDAAFLILFLGGGIYWDLHWRLVR